MLSDLDNYFSQLLIKASSALADHLKNKNINLTFELPNGGWSLQLTRPTISIYLYDLKLLSHPTKGLYNPKDPLRLICTYKITVFSALTKDEHILLNKVLNILLQYVTPPKELLTGNLSQSNIQTTVAHNKEVLRDAADYWRLLGHEIKPSIDYEVMISPIAEASYLDISSLFKLNRDFEIQDVPELIRNILLHDRHFEHENTLSIEFEIPTRQWATTLTKPTVSIHLFNVHVVSESRIDLVYKISAFAFQSRDEHLLLADVIRSLARHRKLMETPSQMIIFLPTASSDPHDSVIDYWRAVDNEIRPTLNYHIALFKKSGKHGAELDDMLYGVEPAGVSQTQPAHLNLSHLNGEQINTICKALQSGFPSRGVLAKMVRVYLNQNLDSIVDSDNQEERIFRLVEWAESTGNMSTLVHGAYKANPGNPALKAMFEDYGNS